jgi:hypothetical protein
MAQKGSCACQEKNQPPIRRKVKGPITYDIAQILKTKSLNRRKKEEAKSFIKESIIEKT